MKIISSWYDYYDTQGGTEEFPLIYNRVTSDWKLKYINSPLEERYFFSQKIGFNKRNNEKFNKYRFSADEAFLIICGKIYPFWVYNSNDVDVFFASSEAFLKFIVGQFGIAREELIDDESISWLYSLNEKENSRFREEIFSKDWTDICVSEGAPILILKQFHDRSVGKNVTGIKKNIKLKGTGFESIVDPYTLYQEIEMFFGTQLVSERNPPTSISDKEQIIKKGFDPKYGFRRRK